MQLLLDSAVETPAGLRRAALVLTYWASLEEAATLGNEASINGPSDGEVTLTTTETATAGDLSHTKTTTKPVSERVTLTLAVPGLDKQLEGFPASATFTAGCDPAVVFAARTTGNPQTPAAPVGNASSGGVAATTTPLVAAPDAPLTNGAPAAGNPPTSAPTGMSASSVEAVSTDRDKAGIPWDARVHSDTRKQNADGTWRFRRNLDEATKNAVMAELKAAVNASLPPVAPSASAAPEAPPAPGYNPAADNAAHLNARAGITNAAPDAPPVPLPAGNLPVSAAPTVGVPDAPNPPVVPTTPVSGFRELMTKINNARAAGRLSQEQVDIALAAAELKTVTELAAQPALVPKVDGVLNGFLNGVLTA